MSKELEDRISEWVDGQVEGVTPVTVEEIVDAPRSNISRSGLATKRRRWLVPAVAAAAALVIGATGLVVLGDDDAPEQVVVGAPADDDEGTEPVSTSIGDPDGDGWETFVEPTFGWTWEQPVGWTSQSERDYCGGMGLSGTFVTNSGKRHSHLRSDSGCTTAWELPNPLPAEFVGVYLVMADSMAVLGDFPPEETDFPLALEDLEPYETVNVEVSPGVPSPTRSIIINHEGRRYGLTSFEGAGVTDEDRAALARMIGSIEPTDLSPTEPIVFGWEPEGAEVLDSGVSFGQLKTLHLPDESDLNGQRMIRVLTQTSASALMSWRHDMDADDPATADMFRRLELEMWEETEGSLAPGATVQRSRLVVRGVPAVLDRWTAGGVERTRLIFFEYDNLAVEVQASGIADSDLLRLVESLQLVAVGGPND